MKYIGKIPHAKIHKLYHLADCFVCPSQKHEAFGLVNIEAMASGVPVIASRNGGIQEIVNHGHNGYLVTQYHRPEGFADYLLKLAQNKRLRENLANSGRADVLQQFTWNQTAAKLSALYYKEHSNRHLKFEVPVVMKSSSDLENVSLSYKKTCRDHVLGR